MFKLRSATSLQAIIREVADQFSIKISEDVAREIRHAHKNNCVLWDETKLITTNNSRISIHKDADGRTFSNM